MPKRPRRGTTGKAGKVRLQTPKVKPKDKKNKSPRIKNRNRQDKVISKRRNVFGYEEVL